MCAQVWMCRPGDAGLTRLPSLHPTNCCTGVLRALCAMASKSKKKSSAVSASSFLELRAEIARHEEDFVQNKGAGKARVGGPSKPEKKVLVQP